MSNANAMSHTPGPWRVEGPLEPMGGVLIGPIVADRSFITYVAHDDEVDPEAEANARLIAAAPDLLAALQWMIENDDTNEGDEPLEHLSGQSWNTVNAYWIEGLNRARAAVVRATGEVA